MIRRVLVVMAALFALSSGAAQAQSACPYIVYGAVLTVAQWQSCFQAKADVTTFSGFGTPAALVGTTPKAGLATTAIRSDGAPALDQTATFSFSHLQNTNLDTGKILSWNSDTGLSRTAAGALALGDGTSGDDSGVLDLAGVKIAGAATSGRYLRGNGTIFTSGQIVSNDLPLATTAAVGGVKCDGTTIVCNSGVITATGAVATSIGVGSTSVTSGTTGRVLYDNGGLLGELAVSGTGSVVLANSPTLITPALGTPVSGVLTNATGLPISTGVSGLGTGVAAFLATPSSANLATAVTGETGTGALVFGTSPTIATPSISSPTLSGTVAGAATIPLSILKTQTADTVVANASGSSASPTAVSIGSCSGASNALTYNTSTHAFGCNTISASGASYVTTITRNMSTASGNVSYTGFGFQPTACQFIETAVSGSSTTSATTFSTNIVGQSGASGTGNSVILSGPSFTWDGSGNLSAITQNAGTIQAHAMCLVNQTGLASPPADCSQTVDVASYDSDGFTLTYTRIGGSGNTTFTVQCWK